MDPHNDSPATPQKAAPPSRDAVRSRAWRNRHGQYLQGLLKAAGVQAQAGSTRSHMAQLKKVFAAVWAQALSAAPASMIRHDPSLSRAERRRISSVKNNRLCRHRHHVFLQGVERELEARGLLPPDIAGLRAQANPPSHSHQGQLAAPRMGQPARTAHPQAAPGHPPAPHAVPVGAVRAPFGSRSDDA